MLKMIRVPRALLSAAFLMLILAESASAFTVNWVAVGFAGNLCDEQPPACYGAVDYIYRISKTEVTNAEYVEFLNAKAAADPFELYDTRMASGYGGIIRSGTSGGFMYGTIAGRQNMPVIWVTFWDSLRFANWLNNGQGSGDTETGSYTITLRGMTLGNIMRNEDAEVVLPSEDEWYKAAYYDTPARGYWNYPIGSDDPPDCEDPSNLEFKANCGRFPFVHELTDVASYTGSPSSQGTFDQGGNVAEWSDDYAFFRTSSRPTRGGFFIQDATELSSSVRNTGGRTSASNVIGFRVASLPEPGAGLLQLTALLVLAALQRRHA
jgi:sulfatase modifying factor 1